jgi:hypothetical protein
MMMLETGEQKRDAWIASLDAVAALEPKIVVAGHKRVGAPDLPGNIAASQEYLRDFSRVANKRDSVEGIVEGMLGLHGDRENPHTLWISARGEIAKRS